ncbi:MAG TPA: NADH-quinone oxidoreductase subunit J [Geobacteraceae bacterium]|nr:NADH-quinone oxidoreductase subunit J [Geobacteraceae bacterium]
MLESLLFLTFAAIAVISGILVVICRNPINSALSLVVTFFCLAVFYVMLDAPFLAAVQIMVYAGAIMVLIIFVIMLLNIQAETGKRAAHSMVIGGIVGVVILLESGWLLTGGRISENRGTIDRALVLKEGHTELIGAAMFGDFLLPFEITSLLLLAAIIGAVILAKKKI